MDACREECLVSIDIAQARENPLVHEPALDSAPSPTHGSAELTLRHLLGVGPKAPEQGVQLLTCAAAQATEATRVAEAKFLGAVFKQQPHMSVSGEGIDHSRDDELACHPQPDDKEERNLVISRAQLNG